MSLYDQAAQGSVPRPAKLPFPGNELINNGRLQSAVAKAIWLVIPLEYYVLTRLDGGIDLGSFIPAATMSLVCVVAIIAIGTIAAIVRPRTTQYVASVRGWTVALLTIWSVALSLLALSYFATSCVIGVHEDIVGTLVCSHWGCTQYPNISWQTFLAYFCYAVFAAFATARLIRIIPQAAEPGVQTSQDRISEPNLIVAAVLVAAIMMVLHRASTLS